MESPRVLPRLAPYAFIFGFVSFVITFVPEMLAPQPEPEWFLISRKAVEVVLSLLVSIFISIQVIGAMVAPDSPSTSFVFKHFKQVAIETVRTVPRILLHFVLLIVPGFVKVIRYVFVPLVVTLYRPYAQGQVDALQKSSELTRGHFLSLAIYYFGTQIVLGFVGVMLPVQVIKHLGLEATSLQGMGLLLVGAFLGMILEIIAIVPMVNFFIEIVRMREGENELAL